jgi:hypothetical protein
MDYPLHKMPGKIALPPLKISTGKDLDDNISSLSSMKDDLPISLQKLCRLFPFHIIVDRNFEIIRIGESWIENEISIIGCKMDHFFEFLLPNSAKFEWNNLELNEDEDFLIRMKDGTSKLENELFFGGIQKLSSSNNFNKGGDAAVTETNSSYIFLIHPTRTNSSNNNFESCDGNAPKFISKSSVPEVKIGDNTPLADQKKKQGDDNSEKTIKQRDIIANVPHDLKTPLAAFLSGVEVISEIAEEVF